MANTIKTLSRYKKNNIAKKIFDELELSVKEFIIKINCNDTLKKKIDDLLSQNDEIIDLMNGGSKKKRKKSKKYRKKSKKHHKRKSRRKRR